MRAKSPVTEWREEHGLSVAELAALCNVTEADIARVEAGEEGLIGEVQDCLTQRGANVSEMASAHSEFLAAIRGSGVAEDDAAGGGQYE
jgi:transcriptional regulator with XRE-family HTH domain